MSETGFRGAESRSSEQSHSGQIDKLISWMIAMDEVEHEPDCMFTPPPQSTPPRPRPASAPITAAVPSMMQQWATPARLVVPSETPRRSSTQRRALFYVPHTLEARRCLVSNCSLKTTTVMCYDHYPAMQEASTASEAILALQYLHAVVVAL